MSRTRSIAIALVLAGTLLASFFAMRRSHEEYRAAGAAASASAAPRPAGSAPALAAASAEPWPDNPVTYDCSGFVPNTAAVPATPPESGPVSVLLEKSRLFGGSAVTCGTGLPLTHEDSVDLDGAIAASARLAATPFARAVIQNAAIAVARCARGLGTKESAPTEAELTALKAHARKLAQRLALDAATLATLESASPSPLAEWIGNDADGPGHAAKLPPTNFHAHGSGLTVATRPLGNVHGADAYYGDLVVVDTQGAAHALHLPRELVLRKTAERGLTVCFAELADPTLYPTPTLRPVALPVGPLDIGGIRCDRCHTRGKRLSENQGAAARPDLERAGLDDVSSWYRTAAQSL